MPSKIVRVKIVRDGGTCFVPVPFDPKAAFGKVRAPVRVTLNGYTYRSTIAAMGGTVCIPLRRSNREAAGLQGGETLDVEIALDTKKRVVNAPADFAAALEAAPPAWERWRDMSFSHQREYAEAITEARKPETRARRIADAVRTIRSRPARTGRPSRRDSGGDVATFLAKLPAERRREVERVRAVLRRHLPSGYEEVVSRNMLVYQVPLERYSDTYNGQPLWYAALASEKSYLSLHLMSVYGDPAQANRLKVGFRAAGKKLDMGKACIHFRTADDLPMDVIGELVASTPPERWIQIAQAARRR